MKKQNIEIQSIRAHRRHRGKLSVESTFPIKDINDLSLAYTPGVAGPCRAIHSKKISARELSSAKNTVAIISDGSAVLGLGNIGPEAALPVMEGKAALMKRFAGINGFPIVLNTTDTNLIVAAVTAIAPTFGAINLEDISAPRCFEIEERLTRTLSIPVMHDDQHGTAIVVLAGLINALAVVKKKAATVRVVIAGAGAAGIATAHLLRMYGFVNLALVDSVGVITQTRTDLSPIKERMAAETNPWVSGSLSDTLKEADVFIGVSKGNTVTRDMIRSMNPGAIVFALANPTPEIEPQQARDAGASIVATGRSDFPNQINNSLAFPGVYKGLLEGNLPQVTDAMKIAAARALARLVKKPTSRKIIPGPFEPGIAAAVARAVRTSAREV